MNYNETLEYLYQSTPVFERVGASAYKEGLSNTIALDDYFGHPHLSFRTIHVAGTNGKGSTSHTLAAILQKAGYKVGLYTSPHLVDFDERIRVNGEPIQHEYVVDFVANHKHFFEPLYPSFFELATAMAFRYFADSQVDIAVVEVGLGGRLDCTNIINPLLSVITNISFDHTGFLGNTLAQIAGEKAGIIKQGVPVVVGEWNDETLPVFKCKAEEKNAPLLLAQEFDALPDFELKGKYQTRNANTIMTAVRELQRQNVIPQGEEGDKIVSAGFANVCRLTGLRGRWETVSESPLVICDTGHNVAGWEYLAPQIEATYRELQSKHQGGEQGTLRIVFGMVDDKDIDTVMGMLPKYAEYYFCQASTHRAIPVERLKEKNEALLGLSARYYSSVKEAYATALADSSQSAGNRDFIFVGGSSYVIADFLS